VNRYDAVLLDAFGTLFELDDPFERLRRSLRERLSLDVEPPAAERAFRAEMAFYQANCHSAGDVHSLAELRRRCGELLAGELGLARPGEQLVPVLADAVSYRVYDDVPPALRAIADRGILIGVVSNWDCSLPDVLRGAGLNVDVAVDSASAKSVKPDPRIFRLALERLAVDPRRALHVGDTPAADGDGARAAGIDVRIVDRSGERADSTIGSLEEIIPLL
jgi:putative hydrolase of the HAD superfamily